MQITPAHDRNDFEVRRNHDLESINIFTDDGKINSSGGSEFAGMPRFKAREAVIEALKKKVHYCSYKLILFSFSIFQFSNNASLKENKNLQRTKAQRQCATEPTQHKK